MILIIRISTQAQAVRAFVQACLGLGPQESFLGYSMSTAPALAASQYLFSNDATQTTLRTHVNFVAIGAERGLGAGQAAVDAGGVAT